MMKWLLITALSILMIALGAVCRYKASGICATGGEFFLALALIVTIGVIERRNNDGTHDKN